VIRLAIGIDPGYLACGIGVIKRGADQRWSALYVQTVRTNTKATLHQRMIAVYGAMLRIPREVFMGVQVHEAVLACEDQAGTQEGRRREGKTNSNALLVQQVVGLARAVAFRDHLRFVEPTPAQAKAVLVGIPKTATKAQVQRAVRAIVKDCPKVMSEHASDALANALAGARMGQ